MSLQQAIDRLGGYRISAARCWREARRHPVWSSLFSDELLDRPLLDKRGGEVSPVPKELELPFYLFLLELAENADPFARELPSVVQSPHGGTAPHLVFSANFQDEIQATEKFLRVVARCEFAPESLDCPEENIANLCFPHDMRKAMSNPKEWNTKWPKFKKEVERKNLWFVNVLRLLETLRAGDYGIFKAQQHELEHQLLELFRNCAPDQRLHSSSESFVKNIASRCADKSHAGWLPFGDHPDYLAALCPVIPENLDLASLTARDLIRWSSDYAKSQNGRGKLALSDTA